MEWWEPDKVPEMFLSLIAANGVSSLIGLLYTAEVSVKEHTGERPPLFFGDHFFSSFHITL